MVCPDPRLREERARRREELLSKTEESLREIAAAAARGKPGPGNRDRAFEALERRASRGKVEKQFRIEVRDDGVSWSRNRDRIAAEARLDGIYVVRTSLGAGDIGADRAVEACKALSRVERAFRTMKTSRLEVRPVFVYGEERVRAHVFLCMLACYVEWHMRRRLAPILFEDDAPEATPVETAEVSGRAKAKAKSKRTADGMPVHSMPTLLADLATLTLNEVELPAIPERPLTIASRPTKLQERAFGLLGIDPSKTVAMQMAGRKG
ncbi:MAG: hypothetical protein OXI87_11115 [Albidovulum sp.]|nr:hypothetical protein [Albidovulum sp.]